MHVVNDGLDRPDAIQTAEEMMRHRSKLLVLLIASFLPPRR